MASWAHGERERRGAVRRLRPRSQDLWAAVDSLVDRAPRISDLAFHGLHLLAARRYRQTGRLVPRDLAAAEKNAAVAGLVAPIVLREARRAYDRTMVLMKGPEVAVKYRDPVLRPFGDLDLLVPDAAEARRALLAAGFVPAGSSDTQSLRWQDVPVLVEIHDRPKWPKRLPLPSRAELLASAEPGSTGVDGVLTLSPEHHAMVLAAHSWARGPLRRLLHLVDLAAVTASLDRRSLDRTARELGMQRVWRTSIGSVDALFDGGSSPLALRIWARHLVQAREPTVLESHLGRWLPPWWALTARNALGANAITISRELFPRGDESWETKLRRTARAFRNLSRPLSDHHRTLGEEGR
jgi:Uncharacterised nucleotidyltransferase